MANGFTFCRTPRIVFGEGNIEKLPEMASSFGSTALLVTGASSFQSTPMWEQFHRDCRSARMDLIHVTCSGEPSPQVVDDIRDGQRRREVNVVIAVGGGSVLDCGKAVSAMLDKKGSVADYLEGVGSRVPEGTKVPFIAVPTTSGTGSEATKNAVLSDIGPDGFKKSLRHDNFVPDVALIDPRLMQSCPADITAACGMDAFTQLLEAYLSPQSGELLDALLLSGLEKIKSHFPSAVRDGGDMDARAAMAYASLISGIGLANAGLGAVHGFASPVGGFFRIPHGVVCGTLVAPATELNIRKVFAGGGHARARQKYVRIGKLFSDRKCESDEFYCRAFVETLERWTREMNIPYLSDYGVTAADVPKIVKKTDIKNNPVPLDQHELSQILLSRIR